MRTALLAMVLGAAVALSGCGDDAKHGRETAGRIAAAIQRVCGVSESNGNVGPRTITPIDLDGKDGPSGYLVTCVNGRTQYVAASKSALQ